MSVPIKQTASAARFPGAPSGLRAVRNAQLLSPAAFPDRTPLSFAVHPRPTNLRSALTHGLPMNMYCSRACDVRISVRLRRGAHTITIANYRETESQIPRRHSRLVLHIRRSVLRRAGHAHLMLTFTALDATNEQRTLTRTLAL